MNKAIRQTMTFSLVLVLILLANFTWVQAFQEEKYAHNALNFRQFLEEKSTPRGQITAGGEILAQSELGSDDFYHRSYTSNPQAYGPVLGYISDLYGAAGVEQSRNGILNGTDPSLFTRRAIDTITGKGREGANVELTLIPEAQLTAYQQLAAQGYTGSVVALRPSTGEILAMASTPSYDPNPIANNDDEVWTELTESANAPLLNHGTQRPLPPGSTFKVLTTIAAVENGATPDTPVTGANEITLPNTETTLENYAGQTCGNGGQVPLSTAFTQSCNTAFAELAIQTGADKLRDVAKRFHVGDTFDDLGVNMEPSTIGEIPDDAALGQTAIGQRDVSFTPLINAMIAGTIANKGVMMEPHLIKSITGRDLNVLSETRPKKIDDKVIDPSTADVLTGLMQGSEGGSGGNPNAIASKTGTAEHGAVRGELAPHVWWMGFTLQSDIAIAVVVEDGGNAGAGATGAAVAAPIGRAVISAIERTGR
ncbi:penicillin-binding protein 2 [Corynebacterium sp. TAE3-ERU12]|uniref:penicillin-binding transpeptidase domain-containing protein n=1 Tax=Corynebacterium sp. TAE3-ERU12 TaxID=2849491 RepID=UPI001C483ABC|nr:penicillin-binding transpeptidase domain-containing protein [Corynebacterium sp. TAE3-ERU12]MBV7294364.1 penicillin-binding protein 2 [Corynebacterium sp. TAE3-ERU12]